MKAKRCYINTGRQAAACARCNPAFASAAAAAGPVLAAARGDGAERAPSTRGLQRGCPEAQPPSSRFTRPAQEAARQAGGLRKAPPSLVRFVPAGWLRGAAAAGSGCKNFLFFSAAQARSLLRWRMQLGCAPGAGQRGRLRSPSAGSRCPPLLSPPPCPGAHPGSCSTHGTKTKPPVPVPVRSLRQGPGAAKHAPPWQRAAASGFCSSKAWSGRRWRGNRKAHEGAEGRWTSGAKAVAKRCCLFRLPALVPAAGGGGLGPGWVAEAGGEDGTSHL